MIQGTVMSLTGNGTSCCMAHVNKMTGFFCNLRNQVDCMRVSSDSNMKRHSLSVEDKSYPVNSFQLYAIEWLALWLFLVVSSYFLLSKNVNLFGCCRENHAEKVSSADRTISNAITENDATAASSGYSHRISSNNSWTELCTKCDGYYEISDLDKASYLHSLLNLEDEDSEWLSDSMPYGCSSESPSTPLGYKFVAYCEISDFEKVSYMHSLLSLHDEDSTWLSDSKSFGCLSENPLTPISYKCDASSEFSDFDKASYMHSLLSLEDEDSEWLSDSKPFGGSSENPSTPLSYKYDASSEISDFDKASYMHSLLSLEDEDSEWLSDSKSFGGSSQNPSTPLSYKYDASSEISDLDKASYMHSLLSLEDEDSEWLSDSKSFGCSSENPSTPLSYKCDDAYCEISDFDKASYLHSLLSLEDEDSEWLSDSTSWSIVVPTSSSFTGVHCGNSEDDISVEHLPETAGVEEFSADEPLFWPFEGSLNWNSEEPWSSFCTSPRRRTKGCNKQKGDEALCSVNSETLSLSMWPKSSAKIVPLECEDDEKVALKSGKVLSNKLLSLNNTFLDEDFDSNKVLLLGKEYFALGQELPIETLVGLKEFDGHEGLDSEFNDVFMQITFLTEQLM